MKKILFVTGNYYPDISATGVCIDNVASYFIKKNWYVSVISKRNSLLWNKYENINEKKIYRIDVNFYERVVQNIFLKIVYKLFSNIINLVLLPIWPIKSIKIIKRYVKQIRTLNKREQFDFIVFAINPPFCLLVNYILKVKYKNEIKAKTVVYYLDMLMEECHSKFLNKEKTNNRIYNLERKTLPMFEMVFFSDSHKDIYNDERYDFIQKRYFIGLPSLMVDCLYENNKDTNNCEILNLVYAGSIGKENRNPDLIIEFFKRLCKEKKIKVNLNFYGKILDGYKFHTYQDNFIKINHGGCLSRTEMIEKYKKADFLLNIDNVNQNIIPSKIYELISMKKPILNFTIYNNSIIDYYLEKYKYFISVKYDKFSKKEIENVKEFLEENRNVKIDSLEILNDYIENTPESFFSIIKNYE